MKMYVMSKGCEVQAKRHQKYNLCLAFVFFSRNIYFGNQQTTQALQIVIYIDFAA